MILLNGEIGSSLMQKEQEAYAQPTLCNGDETYEIVEANAEHDFSALRLIGMLCIRSCWGNAFALNITS